MGTPEHDICMYPTPCRGRYIERNSSMVKLCMPGGARDPRVVLGLPLLTGVANPEQLLPAYQNALLTRTQKLSDLYTRMEVVPAQDRAESYAQPLCSTIFSKEISTPQKSEPIS